MLSDVVFVLLTLHFPGGSFNMECSANGLPNATNMGALNCRKNQCAHFVSEHTSLFFRYNLCRKIKTNERVKTNEKLK